MKEWIILVVIVGVVIGLYLFFKTWGKDDPTPPPPPPPTPCSTPTRVTASKR